ncbi:MAG: type II toxin-antitoxin system VapB family antitoxin [Candidatus Protochlamydia sp.]|nr:type II toxin-antitoxin system VapB family antitoxin [Candidatus Protochlamydia sp.]
MASNIAFDPYLLEEAVRIGHHKTKKEAINSALKEYIMRHKQLNLIEFFGKVDFDDDYDYKKARKKR